MKEVSKEEFDVFINSYPNNLSSSCTTICEPPIRHYRDELLPTKGKIGDMDYFFDKEVARVVMDWLGPDGDHDLSGKYYKYYIKV